MCVFFFFGPFQVVQVMLESQCDPDPRGVYGKTPAHCAVERGSSLDSVSDFVGEIFDQTKTKVGPRGARGFFNGIFTKP